MHMWLLSGSVGRLPFLPRESEHKARCDTSITEVCAWQRRKDEGLTPISTHCWAPLLLEGGSFLIIVWRRKVSCSNCSKPSEILDSRAAQVHNIYCLQAHHESVHAHCCNTAQRENGNDRHKLTTLYHISLASVYILWQLKLFNIRSHHDTVRLPCSFPMPNPDTSSCTCCWTPASRLEDIDDGDSRKNVSWSIHITSPHLIHCW